MSEVLRCGQGKINKIETTDVEIKPDELETMLKTYRVPAGKAGELRDLAGRSRRSRRRVGPPPLSPEFAELSDLELDAVEIRCLHGERIPGPLQSELYMLRQFQSFATTADRVVELLERRQARAALFIAENPPRYRVILSESSLHRMPGGRALDVVLDQAEHLLRLIDTYDRLELHILTYDAPAAFVGVDFVLARFDGAESDFAYIEYPGGGRKVQGRAGLSALLQHWNELHDAALGRQDSIAFLEHLADLARRQWRLGGDDEPTIGPTGASSPIG